MAERAAGLDTPWKETLAQFLPDALALLLPAVHATIDWSRGHEWLDKELQQITPAAVQGRRIVDALARVWRRDGVEEWLLLHVEVQGQRDATFAKRMFTYHYRLLDHFDHDVISIAILTDRAASWRPGQYVRGGSSSRVVFDYTLVKLLDWRGRERELAESVNPFAVVVRAQLLALTTGRTRAGRFAPKLALVRELYERGYSREQVLGVFRFIDWVVLLPAELDEEFWMQIQAEEEARRMPYISSVERLGRERGREEGRLAGLTEGVALAVTIKFGEQGAAVAAMLRRGVDVAVLEQVAAALLRSDVSLAEVQALVKPPPGC